MVNVIFKPLAYLMIHSESHHKKYVDFLAPFLFAGTIGCALLWLHVTLGINIFDGRSKLLSSIIGLIQTLPGFYIAALAAVASFNNLALDSEMTSPTMTIEHNDSYSERLTRRRFLCYMLAYLAFISIIACLSIILIEFFYSFKLITNLIWLKVGYFVGCFTVTAMLTQIFLLTFVCLWYLGDRMHFNAPR